MGKEHGNDNVPGALVIPGDASFFRTTVCGTSLMLRAVCVLGRVADNVHVLKTEAYSDASLRDLEMEINGREMRPRITWAETSESVPTAQGLFVVTRPGVFDQRLCADIEAAAAKDDTIIRCKRPGHDDPVIWFAGPEAARKLVDHLAVAGKDADDAGESGLVHHRVEDFHPNGSVCEIITDEKSRRAAERKVLQGVRKDSDSWLATHVDRKISGLITRWAVHLPITPNQLTVVNSALGIAGALLLGLGTYRAQLAGATFLLLSIIFDGCDGELARVKFMETSFGRKLDFFLDNVVNSLAIFALGVGASRHFGVPAYAYASGAAALMALGCVWPVYVLFFRRPAPVVRRTAQSAGESSLDARSIAENANGRDFIYAIFFLALIGKTHWFIPAALVGLPVFLTTVLVLYARKLREARTV